MDTETIDACVSFLNEEFESDNWKYSENVNIVTSSRVEHYIDFDWFKDGGIIIVARYNPIIDRHIHFPFSSLSAACNYLAEIVVLERT